MGLKKHYVPALAALMICAACSAFAQTVPAATKNHNPWAVGAGFSGYNLDLGEGHLLGETIWVDYTLPLVPSLLRGIGLEVEARDLNYGRAEGVSPNLRMDVASGGVIYALPRYANFRPYGKFMMGYGNLDNGVLGTTLRWHDSRTVTSMGGGVDYRVSRNVWARVDYEYQFWPDYWKLKGETHGKSLTPEGFTVGVKYHFARRPTH